MTVRAKMVLTQVTEFRYGGKQLKFEALYDDSIPEDRRFQTATPSGSIEMHIDNPKALEQFSIGARYYVDFSPAT